MTLFHYCSIDAALSILRNKSIYLSSLTQSNDSMEGKYGIDLIWKMLSAFSEPPPDAFEAVSELEKMHSSIDALGLCLSAKGDVLSQWRGYADDGAGLSLGFSETFISSVVPGNWFFHVRYAEKDQKDALFGYVSEISRYLKAGAFMSLADQRPKGGLFDVIERNYPTDEEIIKNKENFYQVAAKLQRPLYMIKNPCFSQEEEYRIIKYVENDFYQGCSFRSSQGKIVPYFEMKFESIAQSALDKVFVGPKSKNSVDIIRSMLRNFGYGDVDVQPSEATYR